MSGMDAGLALLTGPDAERLLGEQLGSGELLDWRVRQVDHRPGSSTTVAYDATVRGRDGTVRQVLGASTRAGCAGPEVWRFPLDPALPALATATDEAAVRELLTSFGIARGPVRLDVRSYRPRRRAVVEVRAPRCRLFLKVLRPPAVQGLHQRHVLLRGAGLPVPRSLGWSAAGLLVLEALPGRSLRALLREGAAAPDAAAVVALLDRLPEQVCAFPRRASWTDSVAHYARITGSALPEEAERAGQLAERVTALAGDRSGDEPSHGDFYETQLLLDGTRISGLIDVDTVGPGRRADDLACLLAHVNVLAQMEPTHRASSLTLMSGWAAEFDCAVDPVELRARVAGVLVSLATGPYRVQQAGWQGATRDRLDLAEHWLDGVR